IEEFEATLSASQFTAPIEEFAAPAAEEMWPATEPISFEPAPAPPQDEFPATLLAPADEAMPTMTLPVAKAILPASKPPVAAPVAAPATAQPPVARPVTAIPVAAPVTAPARKAKSNRPVLIGAASLVLVVLAVGGYLLFGRGAHSSSTAKDSNPSPTKKVTKKKKTAAESPLPERGEYTVGPSGTYKTIGAALAEIKKHPNNRTTKKAIQTIKGAAGQTYAERIVLDES